MRDLRQAYENAGKVRVLRDNPIRSFGLIQKYMYRRFDQRTPEAEELAIIDMLFDVLVNYLAKLRSIYGLPKPDLAADEQHVFEEIERDIEPGNRLLIGFSYLYHRYLRYDLDLDVAQLSRYFDPTARHLRRLTNEALDHLLQEFLRQELDHRAILRIQRARLSLPNWKFVPVASHQTLIESLVAMIKDKSPPILLWGQPGIGKSVIAVEAAKDLLDQQAVHNAVYINLSRHDASTGSMLFASIVAEALRLPPEQPPNEAIATYLAIQHELDQNIVLILDQADRWLPAILENWDWLGHLATIITSRLHPAHWPGIARQCLELSQSNALMLLAAADLEGVHANAYQEIWALVGGNPQQLLQALSVIDRLPVDAALLHQTVTAQVQANWNQLDTIGQKLWILIDFMSEPEQVSYTRIRDVAQSILGLQIEDLNSALKQVLDYQLLGVSSSSRSDHTYRIDLATYRAIATLESYKLLTTQLAEGVNETSLAVRVLERTAQHNLPLDQLDWFMVLARQHIAETGQWRRWLSLLERLESIKKGGVSFPLVHEKTIALRWVGQLAQAADLCREAVWLCRNAGETYFEVELLIEQANIAFYLGNIEQSLHSAESAANLLESLSYDSRLADRVILALGQAYYKTNPIEAFHLLEKIQQFDATYWDLLARIELELEHVESAFRAAQNAVDLAPGDEHHPARLRALGLLAQVLTSLDIYPDALQQFASTINRMQVSHDALGLARMYTNYGIACARYANTWSPVRGQNLRIRRAHLDMAEESLRRALQLHVHLQDKEGELTANQTLNWVHYLRSQ